MFFSCISFWEECCCQNAMDRSKVAMALSSKAAPQDIPLWDMDDSYHSVLS